MTTTPSESSVWPILHYEDANAAVACLVDVLGFEPISVANDDTDQIVHAELRWPSGGKVIVGSTRHRGGVHGHLEPGTSAMFVLICDVDGIHQRASTAGLTIIEPPHTTRFGNDAKAYAFTLSDTEGYLWTFGKYGVQ